MKSNNHDEIPNEKWGLKRLGKFCVERRQRSAMDTVLIGRAISFAKRRCKKDGSSFTDWKKEHQYSNASASRYMRLAENCKTEADVERLKNIGPLEAYIEAGIEAPRDEEGRESSSQPKPAGHNDEPKVPSWAVADKDDPQVDPDDAEQTIELIPIKDCVEHEIREVLPYQVSLLTEKVAALMEDTDVLRAALPEAKEDRKRIAAEIEALMEALGRLASFLRAKAGPAAKGKPTKRSKAA